MEKWLSAIEASHAPWLASGAKKSLNKPNTKVTLEVIHNETVGVLTRELSTYQPLVIFKTMSTEQQASIMKIFKSDAQHRVLITNA